MSSENLARQCEELEVLTAIYDADLVLLKEDPHIFTVTVTDDGNSVQIQVMFPPDYPESTPPLYELSAPWLRGERRKRLDSNLQLIYLDNPGEAIVHLWVESIREFLQDFADLTSTPDNTADDVTEENYLQTHLESCNLAAATDAEASVPEEVCPDIIHGETVSDRRSVFQAHAAYVTSAAQVEMVLDKLKENKKIAAATHNIFAYRIARATREGREVWLQGNEDDGETHASSRMLHLMQILEVRDVIVVVTRWYGGVHLGPDRFKHINNCTRDILLQAGAVPDKSQKTKGKGKKQKGKS